MSLFFVAILLITSTLHSQLLQRSLIESSFDKIRTEIQQDFSNGIALDKIIFCYEHYQDHYPAVERDKQLLGHKMDSTWQQLVTTYYAPDQLEQRALRCVWAQLKTIESELHEIEISRVLSFLEDTMEYTQWLDVNSHSYKADTALSKFVECLDVEQVQEVLLTYYLQTEQNYRQLTEAKRALELMLAYGLLIYLRNFQPGDAKNQKKCTIVTFIARGITLLENAIKDLYA